ncbi:MAG TPA: hypothetical protein DCQ98_09265 [Planctomycetaceae bacterium]|nr:hypothetical protein [Planctomycetaceae bacterium]HRF00583.1 type VI secretion system baseplate subunit TssK [Pirellulaceae bacterium]
MKHPGIFWSQGLFLRPHHLQASDRHRDELLFETLAARLEGCYGLQRIELEGSALDAQQFGVTRLRALLRDGSLVDLSGGAPGRCDLKDLPRSEPIRIAIGAAQRRDDLPAVARTSTDIAARFVARRIEVRDESTGSDPQQLDFRELNLRWFLPGQPRDGFETLDVAQLRWNVDRGQWQIDLGWLPTALSIDAWRGLGWRDAEGIGDLLENRAETIAQRIASKRIAIGSSGQDLEFSRLMDAINDALGESRSYRSPARPHPETLYAALCRTVGRLALFHPDVRMPRDVPAYDHDHPEPVFRWLRERIDASLAQDYEDPYQIRPFVGEGGDLFLRLDRRWLDADHTLLFAYRMTRLPGKDLKWEWGLLKPRLSSPDLIRTVSEQHIVAAERSLVSVDPRPTFLPRDLTCFRFDKGHEYFSPVRDSGGIGMRLRGLEGLAAVRDGESVVRWPIDGRQVEAEFFAVAYPNPKGS